jgi:phosphoribosylaminoimidazolecarboxamide formyltransferase/IMP cyclohydrolase
MKKRALISVFDKRNIVKFAKKLSDLSYEIISTGGTAKLLSESGISITPVSEITNFPEMMNGRVKTLHPKIHGGILGDWDIESHIKEATELGINPIEIVVVNLYPFEKTVLNPESSHQDIIENIDIGGPSMLRSAAKNYKHVTVITDFNDYDRVIVELEKNGETSISTRQKLSYKAFSLTAHYDAMIAAYFSKLEKDSLPDSLSISYKKTEQLRYGENPHQEAAFYSDKNNEIISQIFGKKLSFNNYMDIDSAIRIISKFMNDDPTIAILKHTNPSGIGIGKNLSEAYQKAFATDTMSPFGGIVIMNKPLDLEAAKEINKVFTEIIISPEFSEEVLSFLKKKKNRRLIKVNFEKMEYLKSQKNTRSLLNGLLVQDSDMLKDNYEDWKIVTESKPTESELKALKFGWKVVATLKSNAVCFTTFDRTIGLGIGQTSRVDSTEIAIFKANKFGLNIENSICASDAFFPFRDSVDKLSKLGIKAIIQPGGSKRDQEVIDACNEYGMSMIFTGKRHFRH